jgi:hypothetical protein
MSSGSGPASASFQKSGHSSGAVAPRSSPALSWAQALPRATPSARRASAALAARRACFSLDSNAAPHFARRVRSSSASAWQASTVVNMPTTFWFCTMTAEPYLFAAMVSTTSSSGASGPTL